MEPKLKSQGSQKEAKHQWWMRSTKVDWRVCPNNREIPLWLQGPFMIITNRIAL